MIIILILLIKLLITLIKEAKAKGLLEATVPTIDFTAYYSTSLDPTISASLRPLADSSSGTVATVPKYPLGTTVPALPVAPLP